MVNNQAKIMFNFLKVCSNTEKAALVGHLYFSTMGLAKTIKLNILTGRWKKVTMFISMMRHRREKLQSAVLLCTMETFNKSHGHDAVVSQSQLWASIWKYPYSRHFLPLPTLFQQHHYVGHTSLSEHTYKSHTADWRWPLRYTLNSTRALQ